MNCPMLDFSSLSRWRGINRDPPELPILMDEIRSIERDIVFLANLGLQAIMTEEDEE